MNILPENGLVNSSDTKVADANANSLKNQLGWLREWEQAQWRADGQRDNSAAREKLPQNLPPSDSPKPEFRIVNETESRAAALGTDKPSMPSTVTHAGSPELSAPQAYAATIQNNITANVPLGGVAAPWVYSPAPLSTLTEVLSTTRYLNMSARLTEWQAYLLHVVAHSAGMRVWVRDKRLNDLTDTDLLSKIKQELAAQGLRLASLTVNGREIWRMDSLANEILAPLDGNGTSVLDRVY